MRDFFVNCKNDGRIRSRLDNRGPNALVHAPYPFRFNDVPGSAYDVPVDCLVHPLAVAGMPLKASNLQECVSQVMP